MSVWSVDFSKEFTILLEAPTREAAFFAASQSIDAGDLDRDWETGTWEAFVAKTPVKSEPNHGVKDGAIVAIEDARTTEGPK